MVPAEYSADFSIPGGDLESESFAHDPAEQPTVYSVIPELDRRLVGRRVSLAVLRERYTDADPEALLSRDTDDPDLILLQNIFKFATKTWREIEQHGMASFPDTPQLLFELFTNECDHVRVLEAIPCDLSPEQAQSPKHRVLVGSGLVVKALPGTVPVELLDYLANLYGGSHEDILARIDHGKRLYVGPEARIIGSRGTALGHLLLPFLEAAKDRFLITRVLVGPSEYAHRDALHTYQRLGLVRTGITVPDTVRYAGKDIEGLYEFLVYRPESDEGKGAIRVFREHYAELERTTVRRLAGVFPLLPAHGAVVGLVSPHRRDAYDLAALYPGNRVVYSDSQPEVNVGDYERRENLAILSTKDGPLALPDSMLDALVVVDALSGVAVHGDSAPTFAKRALDKIRTGGTITIVEPIYARDSLEKLIDQHGLRLMGSRVIAADESHPHLDRMCVVSAEKVAIGEGAKIVWREVEPVVEPEFLCVKVYKTPSGRTVELVERPGETVDVFPFAGDRVLARRGARPLLILPDRGVPLDQSRSGAYPVEQLSARPSAGNTEGEQVDARTAALNIARDHFHIPIEAARVLEPISYLTLPTEIDEKVDAVPIELDHVNYWIKLGKHPTGLRSAGEVCSHQMDLNLLSALTGTHSDERIPRMARELLLREGRSFGPWPWPRTELRVQDVSRLRISDISEAITPERDRAIFTEVPEQAPGTYHRIKRAYFEELDPRGEKVGESSLEFSIPSELSHIHFRGVDYPVSNNMTSLIPVINTSDGILIGIARFDAAAVQNYSTQLYGYRSSQYATLPLCSLGEGMDSFASAADFIVEGVCKSLGLKVIRIGRLGGMYFPSLGAPLKTVESGWIEADAESAIANPLFSWVPLRESYLPLFSDPDQRHLRRFLVCGPTLTTSLRFAHSVGLV